MAAGVHFEVEEELADEIEAALGTLMLAMQNAIDRLGAHCSNTGDREDKKDLLKYLLFWKGGPQYLGLEEDGEIIKVYVRKTKD